jgi:large subunit ribosomal protein L4e
MKIGIYNLAGKEKGKIEIPKIFLEPVRIDLIRKAVLAERSKERRPYGSDPLAGQRSSAHYHGRRHTRHSMMNRELARMKRIHDQGFLNLTARVVPQAIKGRKAHPPKSKKIWELKINKKERMKALRSALAATFDRNLVSERGHKIDGIKNIPLVFEDDFQKLKKAKDVIEVLKKIGLEEELERCKKRKIRAGKGKTRGRKYKNRKGPLIVIGKDEGISKAVKNIAGIDISIPKNLSVRMVAPGTHPGRLTIWTKSALQSFGEKNE